ncbi:MAG: ThiF family adenylyltransferase [Actinobacteria bacterium]|nr:ThiF family adenylyltransferase [Actinomycetota bacterium]
MTTWKVYIRGDHWHRLHEHLHGSPGEHGAVLLCGVARGVDHERLLVHEVHIAQDGSDYTYGDGVYRLNGAFATRQALRARSEALVYIAVHPHGGFDSVEFSGVDLRSQHNSTKPLLAASGKDRVGWLVTAPAAANGVIRTKDGEEPIAEVVVLDEYQRLVRTPRPANSTIVRTEPRFARQALIYGDVGQRMFAGATVGIVGLGGGGAVLNDMLSSLGVGHLVHIDPERVDISNLPRLIGATRWDALEPISRWLPEKLRERLSRSKVAVAKRVARRNNPKIRLTTLRRAANHNDAVEALLKCDYIFLAADTAGARLLVNAVSAQYLIPMTQIGAKVRLDDEGTVKDVYSVSRVVGRAPGCMWCNGLINTTRLAEEAVSVEQRADQQYVQGVANPSVKSLNVIGAAWAVEDFRNWFTGLRSAGQLYTTAHPHEPRVTSSIPRHDAECPFCTDALGRGATAALPGVT